MSGNAIPLSESGQRESKQRKSNERAPAEFWSLWPLLLLAVAHLPLLWAEWRMQWSREHYQFFPLALISFVCYFRARRFPGAFHWTPLCWCLLAVDVMLLCAGSGVFLQLTGSGLGASPLLGTIGFWLLIWAICLACRDRDVKSSLSYLIILPLITIRPPLGADRDLILWLQRMTSSIASELLNFFNYLHVRQGVILRFPGKAFEVENACSGVQSLFAVLFLAAFVTCGYRRRLFHTVIVIASGLLFAAVMNVMRISVIAVAWETSTLDLTSGFVHDAIGYVALFAAAMLVFSADAFLAFCLDFVPDQEGAGITAIYRNPFVGIWNWLFSLAPRQGVSKPVFQWLHKKQIIAVGAIAGVLCVTCLFFQLRDPSLF